jgi:hypothetical protein
VQTADFIIQGLKQLGAEGCVPMVHGKRRRELSSFMKRVRDLLSTKKKRSGAGSLTENLTEWSVDVM